MKVKHIRPKILYYFQENLDKLLGSLTFPVLSSTWWLENTVLENNAINKKRSPGGKVQLKTIEASRSNFNCLIPHMNTTNYFEVI